jgi:hypothetical protein
MNLLPQSEIRNLIVGHEKPCVSLYMPTIKAGGEIQQNPIRFKNLIRTAEKQLVESGLRSPDARALLEPLYDLLNNEVFWQYQSEGLIVFVSRDYTRHYRLPLEFKESIYIGDSFHLKPLMPLFVNNGHYYLLSLSQQGVRLIKGTRFSMDEIDLEDIPQTLAEALRWDDPEPQLQHHETEGPSTGGEMTGIYHGHGVGTDDQKEDILRFFQKVDKGLQKLLSEEGAPLVLAGVEYLLPLYRQANSYKHFIEAEITGNLDKMSLKQLHQQAWEVVEPVFRKEQSEAEQFYQQHKQTGRSSEDLEEVVQAAIYGQVDRLFVVMSEEQWGTFDPETGQVQFHSEKRSDSLDLLDLAASHTFINGGKVFAVMEDEMPSETNVAAVLRWQGSPMGENQ